ncbi:hypothetical protein [Burkholderia ubonensis]|uniref:hypothetical protein n=1 Tax=Burkholderia ubonensis TaxID=101571 RepID=UPI000B0A5473|nr:hypothetical protein [Burkholderia ubonensis]
MSKATSLYHGHCFAAAAISMPKHWNFRHFSKVTAPRSGHIPWRSGTRRVDLDAPDEFSAIPRPAHVTQILISMYSLITRRACSCVEKH